MSTKSPLPLYELTMKNLLKSETLSSTALQDLPTMIFHDLFMNAFMGEHNEALKVMVQAWPFPCLKLKSLLNLRKNPQSQSGACMLEEKNQQALEAILDGLDTQLSQKVQHRRWKLQVLDWRDRDDDFWTSPPRNMSAAYSTDPRRLYADNPGLFDKNVTLRIFANLYFGGRMLCCVTQDILQLCLLNWVRKRKASVHLSCENVVIDTRAIFAVLELLQGVQLDSIHDLHLFSDWDRESVKVFVPRLKKIKNLHIFRLSRLSPNDITLARKKKWYSRFYASHLEQLQSLRELHMDQVFFLKGNLHNFFRTQMPLELFSLSSSPLMESDLIHFSEWSSTSQLKSLTLRNISMASFNPESLQILIDNLVNTLKTLALVHCDLTDPQLLAILPSLSQCHNLETFSFYGNHISLRSLQALLRLSGRMSQLTLMLCPAPLESYVSNIPTAFVHPQKFARVFVELTQVLEHLKPSLIVKICIHSCVFCMLYKFCTLQPKGNWEMAKGNHY